MKHSNTRAILISLGANIAITLAKFIAAAFTMSAGMLSEAVHSFSNITHELLLLLGVREAEAPPDERHPYGQGKAVYFWGLIAVIFFGVSGVVAFYDGWNQVQRPQTVAWPVIACAILTVSMVANGVALREAVLQFLRVKGNAPFFPALMTTKDPSMRLLILQNGLDILAEGLALIGILLFIVTGNSVFDGAAGMIIGVSLVLAAVWQAGQIKGLLIGKSAGPVVTSQIRQIVSAQREPMGIEEITTLVMGPEAILVTMRVQCADSIHPGALSQATHDLEREIKLALPSVKYVYVKATSRAQIFDAPVQAVHSGSGID